MTLTNINGTNLFLETKGTGLPILLFHGGLGLDHTYLMPYFDILADKYQLIYYDHRGNGRSDQPNDYSQLDFELLCADADAVRKYLGHEKVIVFGHSYGGFIAQKYALQYPDSLLGLILCDAVPAFDYHPAPNGTEEQLKAFGEAFTRPMNDDEDWRTIWTTIIEMYFHNYDPAVGDALDASTHYVSEAWNQGSALLGSFNTLDDLGNISVPTLVVSGQNDIITPPDPGSKRISSLIPNSSLEIFENSGHYPFIEEQDEFFKVLRGWLGQFD